MNKLLLNARCAESLLTHTRFNEHSRELTVVNEPHFIQLADYLFRNGLRNGQLSQSCLDFLARARAVLDIVQTPFHRLEINVLIHQFLTRVMAQVHVLLEVLAHHNVDVQSKSVRFVQKQRAPIRVLFLKG